MKEFFKKFFTRSTILMIISVILSGLATLVSRKQTDMAIEKEVVKKLSENDIRNTVN